MEPNTDIQPLLSHVVPWVLVMFRLAGVFFMAPVLTSVNIPRQHKALLVVMLSAAVFPIVRTSLTGPVRVDLWGLIPLIVSESLIGLAMGAIASIPLLSLEMSGVLMGQSMGLGLAKIYNPEADFEADVLGQFLYYIGAGIFVALGGLERLMGGIIESFSRVPLGGFATDRAPLDLLTGTLASGFELAIRVAAPVTGIVLLLVIVIGVMGKTMPQINIMSVGFAVKIIAGMAMLTVALYAVGHAVGDEIVAALGGVLRWVRTL
jgi:flagellar biosynthetic protein FliR